MIGTFIAALSSIYSQLRFVRVTHINDPVAPADLHSSQTSDFVNLDVSARGSKSAVQGLTLRNS